MVTQSNAKLKPMPFLVPTSAETISARVLFKQSRDETDSLNVFCNSVPL